MTTASDPTFYRTPGAAATADPEQLAYVVAFHWPDATNGTRPDALAVVDVKPESSDYGQVVGWVDMPSPGDELHHFGWNACSSALCHEGHHLPERRFLLLPGIRSSRINVVDTRPDPRQPKLSGVIEPEELGRAGYSRPHTLHCGPDGLFLSNLGGVAADGPGGIAMLDHDSFKVLGQWEADRGPQYMAYDFWWHMGANTLVSSEWGTPSMIENGVVPELLLGRKYGHRIHFWDMTTRRHVQALDLGDEHQMALELRPAHDPTKTYGFLGVVTNAEDLSASVWAWHRDGDRWAIDKVIEIPAQPADPATLPPLLQGFGAVPPLVTDINLTVDDRQLYVSCWGTGELRQYDVTDPFRPRHTGSVHLGGIVNQTPHPAEPDRPLLGGPQMVEVSRDGRRVYFTNSLYGAWDEQFYPDGVGAWMVKVNADADGIAVDPDFFVTDFRGLRVHQVRLQGGDASSDSYCEA
jgi:selenium-binding protein 1